LASSEDLRRESERIREEIDALLDEKYRIEAECSAIRGRARLYAALKARFLLQAIEQRIYLLKLRNTAVRNCYTQLRQEEERRPA
jgi:hypothetical protein